MRDGGPSLPPRIAAWPVEDRALVRLLRVALGTGPADASACWPAEADETRFLAGMERHRVAPFLHARLPAAAGAGLPERVRAGIAASASGNARRALARTAELARLEQQLAGQGIPVVCVKGPLLARALHGDVGARHAGDLDLLIDEAHAGRADQWLRAAGFRRMQPNFELTPLQHRKYTEVRHEFGYLSADGSLRLEIMWRLVNQEHFHRGVRGETPAQTALAGRMLAVLPAETAALHLLLHGADHGWFRLFWLLDIALLMQRGALDWPRVLARAEAAKLERVFWQGILLAQELLAVPLPAGLPAPPGTPVIARLVTDAYRHMELAPEAVTTGAAHWWMTGYAWRLQSSWRVRLRALRPRVVNPADWRTLPLPDRWFALYYVLWPALWLLRWWRNAGGPGQGGPAA